MSAHSANRERWYAASRQQDHRERVRRVISAARRLYAAERDWSCDPAVAARKAADVSLDDLATWLEQRAGLR